MSLLLAAKSRMLVLLKQHAIALIAVFIALGGTSYAVTNDGGGAKSARGPLFACVTQEFNTLNLTTRSAGCPAGEYMISWNKTGKRGVRGIRGRRGARGVIGPAGMVGATGIPGPRGQIGPQGLQGPADGPAGGDLTGNYPDPVIATGAITAAKVAANTLTGDQIDESTLAKVPSASATDSIIPAITDETTFENISPNLPASVVVTCPRNGLAFRGSETSVGVTIISRTLDRHSYTVNVTAGGGMGSHYVRAKLICIG